LSLSYGDPTWCGRALNRRMFSRMFAGTTPSWNVFSHERSIDKVSELYPVRWAAASGFALSWGFDWAAIVGTIASKKKHAERSIMNKAPEMVSIEEVLCRLLSYTSS
jgi:hypothetical protein